MLSLTLYSVSFEIECVDPNSFLVSIKSNVVIKLLTSILVFIVFEFKVLRSLSNENW